MRNIEYNCLYKLLPFKLKSPIDHKEHTYYAFITGGRGWSGQVFYAPVNKEAEVHARVLYSATFQGRKEHVVVIEKGADDDTQSFSKRPYIRKNGTTNGHYGDPKILKLREQYGLNCFSGEEVVRYVKRVRDYYTNRADNAEFAKTREAALTELLANSDKVHCIASIPSNARLLKIR